MKNSQLQISVSHGLQNKQNHIFKIKCIKQSQAHSHLHLKKELGCI